EAPLVSDFPTRQLPPLRHRDDRLLVDLEQPRELCRREDLELLGRPEPGAAHAELRPRAPEPAEGGRVLGIDVSRGEPRDQLALRCPQGARGALQLLRLGGGDAHEQRCLVGLSPRAGHRDIEDIKKISRVKLDGATSSARTKTAACRARSRRPPRQGFAGSASARLRPRKSFDAARASLRVTSAATLFASSAAAISRTARAFGVTPCTTSTGT